MAFIIISKLIIYLSISILMGSFILSVISPNHKPKVNIKRKYLIMAVLSICVFSLTPIFPLIAHLYESMGLQRSMTTVLLTFEIGKALIFTIIIAAFLLLMLIKINNLKQPIYSWIGCFLTFLLILGLSWSSHAHSMEQLKGFLIHSVHYTVISIWMGILFVVGWFSSDFAKWRQFLQWFTPLAVTCVVMTIGSGLLLMTVVIDLSQYQNSWPYDYGQLLLWKHLFIIALLVYAVINGIFIRRRVSTDKNFNPLPWVKAESVIGLVILSVTAALGQQSPPSKLGDDTLSKLFSFIYQGQIESGMNVDFNVTSLSMFFFFISIIFIVFIIYSYIKKVPAQVTLLLSILFVLSGYLALMMSIG